LNKQEEIKVVIDIPDILKEEQYMNTEELDFSGYNLNINKEDMIIMYPDIVKTITNKEDITYKIVLEIVKMKRSDLFQYLPIEHLEKIIDEQPEMFL